MKDPWRLEGESASLTLVRVPAGRWWSPEFVGQLETELARVDALLLLAYTPPRDRDPQRWIHHEHEVNVTGANRIIDLASRLDTRIVFTSSADVYGPVARGRVSEQAEVNPVTPYAEAKCAVEAHLGDLVDRGNACSVRLATVYGPGENGPRAIPSFIRAYLTGKRPTLHGSGADIRDYVCVEDVATTLVSAARVHPDSLRSSGGIFNVGSGIGRRTRDVLRAVAAAMGVEPLAEQVDSNRQPSHLILEPSLAIKTFGVEFARDFDQEIRKEVAWLRTRISESERLSDVPRPR